MASILDSVKRSFLGLRGKTPSGYSIESRLSAIPVVASSTPARSFPSRNPIITPEVEITTEAAELLLTEDNLILITE